MVNYSGKIEGLHGIVTILLCRARQACLRIENLIRISFTLLMIVSFLGAPTPAKAQVSNAEFGKLVPAEKVKTAYNLDVYKVSSPDLGWVYTQMYVFSAATNLSWQQREHLANFAKLLAYGPSQAYKSAADSAQRIKAAGGFTQLFMEEDGFGILDAIPIEHAEVGLWAMNQRLEARNRMLNHPGWVPNDTPVSYETQSFPLEIRQTLTPGHPYAHSKYPPAKWQMGTAVAVPRPADMARLLLTRASTSVVVYGPFEGATGDYKIKRAFKSSLPGGTRVLPPVPDEGAQIKQEDRSEGRLKVRAQFWLKMTGRALTQRENLQSIPPVAFGVDYPFATGTTLGNPNGEQQKDLTAIRQRADAMALAQIVGAEVLNQGAVSWFRTRTVWGRKGEISKKEAKIINKIRSVAKKPPSKAKLEEIKIALWRSRLKAMQRPETLVWNLAKAAAQGGDISLWEAETWAISQISTQSVSRLARDLLEAHRIIILEGSDGNHG